jgi:hypothetical protein
VFRNARQPNSVCALQTAGPLGPVILERNEALHLARAETRLQPLDQSRQPFALALPVREELAVRRCALDDVLGLQGELERRRGQLQPGEPLAQQHE